MPECTNDPRFEYDETKGQITAVRLSEPLRDIVSKVMRTQIYTRMRDAKLDTQSRIDSLVVTRKCECPHPQFSFTTNHNPSPPKLCQ